MLGGGSQPVSSLLQLDIYDKYLPHPGFELAIIIAFKTFKYVIETRLIAYSF